MNKYIISDPAVIHHVLDENSGFPNNSSLPLLVYKGAFYFSENDAAKFIEEIFHQNNWKNTWRDGIYDYHHYHSTAHEALGVYEGETDVQFGGPSGIALHVSKGDVIVIPAGVAHKNNGSNENFKCVGGYA